MKNYYEILGIPENADTTTIKKAFRKLAVKYHPDKNPGNERWAETKFKEINEAYSILGDTARRNEYDTRRKSPFAASGNGGFSYNQQDIFRTSFSNPYFYEQLDRLFQEMGLRFDRDFVNSSFFDGRGDFYFYGNRSNQTTPANSGAYSRNSQAYRPVMILPFGFRQFRRIFKWILKYFFGLNLTGANPDIHQNIKLTRTEAEKGCTKKITYKRNNRKKRLMVTIPPGIKTGMKIRLKGMGEQGYRTGDLYLHVKAKPGYY